MEKFLRRFMTVAVLLVGSVHFAHAGQWRSMILTDKSGQDFAVNMSDNVKMMFEAGKMVITDGISRTDIPMEQLASWVMSETVYDEDILSGMDNISDEDFYLVRFDGSDIIVLSRDSEISVYDLQGRAVGQFLSDESGRMNVSVLGSGVYVVKVGSCSLKIRVR